jgi:hypothetical protein
MKYEQGQDTTRHSDISSSFPTLENPHVLCLDISPCYIENLFVQTWTSLIIELTTEKKLMAYRDIKSITARQILVIVIQF